MTSVGVLPGKGGEMHSSRSPELDDGSLAMVQAYYGKVLTSNQDLKTNACCVAESVPAHILPLVSRVHEEVRSRFYGCGLVIPPLLEGLTVLDLGCGSGRDVYILSQLVGERGRVIGVDMTDEQLAVALRHEEWHRQMFEYERSNVEFRHGYIEDLKSAGLGDRSVDVVVSNCVVNLSPDKNRVLREVLRVLKPGGEFYVSDVYADRRLPPALRQDQELLGECLGGALYIEDLRRILADLGVFDFRIMCRSSIAITSDTVRSKVGRARFASFTHRILKLDLEDRCEDYGQVAIYRGTVPHAPHVFVLDDHHVFETGRPMLVCSNTAAMLSETRYGKHFTVQGDKAIHFGLFPCGPSQSGVQGDGQAGGQATSCC